ncbi:MAG: hypothetical protein IH983_03465 [Planctomycetes bacterium]|nr:hypothetical protein [Planctomycetota bacterium]
MTSMNEVPVRFWLLIGLGYLGSMFVVAFITAWCLKWPTKWIAKKPIGYWHCYWTEMIMYGVGFGAGVVLALFADLTETLGDLETAANVLSCGSVILGFAIGVGIVSMRVGVTPGKAALIFLLRAALIIPAIVVISIIGMVLALVFG